MGHHGSHVVRGLEMWTCLCGRCGARGISSDGREGVGTEESREIGPLSVAAARSHLLVPLCDRHVESIVDAGGLGLGLSEMTGGVTRKTVSRGLGLGLSGLGEGQEGLGLGLSRLGDGRRARRPLGFAFPHTFHSVPHTPAPSTQPRPAPHLPLLQPSGQVVLHWESEIDVHGGAPGCSSGLATEGEEEG